MMNVYFICMSRNNIPYYDIDPSKEVVMCSLYEPGNVSKWEVVPIGYHWRKESDE